MVQEDWVLLRVESGLGSWLRWSAGAHTLLMGAAFAVLLLLTLEQAANQALPPGARDAMRGVLLAVALAACVPLAALAWAHHRRRVQAVEVDPTGLTLITRGAPVRASIANLAEVRPGAEPAFLPRGHDARQRGELADIPGFVASLRFKLHDGTRWEFAAREAEDVASILAWLEVLGLGDRIAAPPTALAARHEAEESIRRARLVLQVAVVLGGVAMTSQVVSRLRPGLSAWAVPVSVGALLAGCALYVASYRAQTQAARAWLEARSRGSGPPPKPMPELAPPAPR